MRLPACSYHSTALFSWNGPRVPSHNVQHWLLKMNNRFELIKLLSRNLGHISDQFSRLTKVFCSIHGNAVNYIQEAIIP